MVGWVEGGDRNCSTTPPRRHPKSKLNVILTLVCLEKTVRDQTPEDLQSFQVTDGLHNC